MQSETTQKTEVTLELRTFGVILSIFELYGFDWKEYSIEDLTSRVLTILTDGLLNEGAVDSLDDETLISKLSFFFPALRKELEEAERDLAEIEQQLQSSPSPSHPAELPTENLPEDLFSDSEEEETLAVDFSSLDQSDPLVQLCKEDESRQKALCRVYARIPKEKRGSKQAAKMLAVELGE